MQLVRAIYPLVVIALNSCPASPGTRARHHHACVKPHFTHTLHNILLSGVLVVELWHSLKKHHLYAVFFDILYNFQLVFYTKMWHRTIVYNDLTSPYHRKHSAVSGTFLDNLKFTLFKRSLINYYQLKNSEKHFVCKSDPQISFFHHKKNVQIPNLFNFNKN